MTDTHCNDYDDYLADDDNDDKDDDKTTMMSGANDEDGRDITKMNLWPSLNRSNVHWMLN